MKQGDRGREVLELQMLLIMAGFDPGPLDGVFGARTLDGYRHAVTYRQSWEAPDADDIAYLRALPRRAVELPRILTPVTVEDMRAVLIYGYEVELQTFEEAEMGGGGPMEKAVNCALAQLCVEHVCESWFELDARRIAPWLQPTHGAQTYIYVWNYNIGNRQVRQKDRDDSYLQLGPPKVPYFIMSPVDGVGDAAHRATSAHYAYANATEGAAAYWRFLSGHCAPALAAFEAGDLAVAAHELNAGEWRYSGDEAAYARAMMDMYERFSAG
jgi:hypothetical protein